MEPLTSLFPLSYQALGMTEQEHDALFKKVENSEVGKDWYSECAFKNKQYVILIAN